MKFGKQIHYCANCGKELYDSRLDTRRPSICDDPEYKCYKEYELKYARSILGKDEV